MEREKQLIAQRACARVLVVDDVAVFRSVMRALLEATENLEACAEAESAERAIELVAEIEPDMVLLDVWMPGMDGMAAAREIKARRPETVVVLTSTTHPTELPFSRLELGADAVVWKSDLAPRLLEDIWRRSGEQEHF